MVDHNEKRYPVFVNSFAGKFAHSLGGLEIIFVPCIVVAVMVFFGVFLVWRKKLGVRLVSYALIALVTSFFCLPSAEGVEIELDMKEHHNS